MGGGMRVAILLLGTLLCSGSDGQAILGMDWLGGLTENIGTLNRNIQENVQQLHQRIQQTVQANLEQTQRLTKNLNEELASGRLKPVVGGSNMVVTNDDGTTIVQSGRTSDGKLFVRESTDKIVGDTLRHVDKIYDPATNTSRVHGYTLDLKDPNAKPVPIHEAA